MALGRCAWLALLCALASIQCAGVHAEQQELYRRPPATPQLPMDHPRLARAPGVNQFTPEQVHLALSGPGAYAVSWVTYPDGVDEGDGEEAFQAALLLSSSSSSGGGGPKGEAPARLATLPRKLRAAAQHALEQPQPRQQQEEQLRLSRHQRQRRGGCLSLRQTRARSVVQYGTAPGQYDFTVEGEFDCYSTPVYQSGALHHVVLGQGAEGPLPPNATVYYRVGDPDRSWSDELSFVTAPRVGPASLPYRLGLVGDLGQTENSISTLEHLGVQSADSVLLVGDLSYADGYQPRWDSWGRMMAPFTQGQVWMYTEGNHEIEPDTNSPEFLAYTSRFHLPNKPSGSTSKLYYSYDLAGAHIVSLGSYTEYGPRSEQYAWLRQDLAAVDRARTPWVIVGMHAPWYNSNFNHQGEGEAMRQAMEALLYEHGVDLVFAGHVHAYERSEHVYDEQRDDCGPIYINVGDGGNREGLDTSYYDQPVWSAYRESSYGHGTLDLQDELHADWRWHRNQDGSGVTADDTRIRRNPECKPALRAERLAAHRARAAGAAQAAAEAATAATPAAHAAAWLQAAAARLRAALLP